MLRFPGIQGNDFAWDLRDDLSSLEELSPVQLPF